MAEPSQSAPTPRDGIAGIGHSREAKIVALAERQEGLISWRQLIACGLTRSTIGRWRDRGRLHRIHPGVYALGHRRLSNRGRLVAALLYAGPGAALGGRSATAWWELTESLPRVIEVATPHRRRSLPGVRIRHRPALERVIHRGLPVTPVARTLLDFAREAPRRELRRALAEADHRGRLDVDGVMASCGRGRPGTRALREAVATHLPQLARTRSELERRFLVLCERAALPLPEVNVRLGGFEVDALWREHRVVVEQDGAEAHAGPAAVARDRNRDLALRELGYTVLRYTWHQITREPARVVAELRRALRA